MKHIFIINPAAGKDNSFDNIRKILELKKVEVDYELYETQAPGDATAYIRKYCTEHTKYCYHERNKQRSKIKYVTNIRAKNQRRLFKIFRPNDSARTLIDKEHFYCFVNE